MATRASAVAGGQAEAQVKRRPSEGPLPLAME